MSLAEILCALSISMSIGDAPKNADFACKHMHTVVEAAKERKINVPLVVRLAGTNFEEGKKILQNSNLKIISADNLDDAAKKIVEAIK